MADFSSLPLPQRVDRIVKVGDQEAVEHVSEPGALSDCYLLFTKDSTAPFAIAKRTFTEQDVDDAGFRGFLKEQQLYRREVAAWRLFADGILPQALVPRALYVPEPKATDEGKYIVLEFLSDARIHQFTKGPLADDDLKRVVSGLAQLHAATLGKDETLDQFPSALGGLDLQCQTMHALLDEQWEGLVKNQAVQIGEIETAAYRNLKRKVREILGWSIAPPKELSCITHGDFFQNNVLFRKDRDGNTTDPAFIDFQFAHAGNGLIDLATLFFSTGKDLLVDIPRQMELLKYYGDSLTAGVESYNPAMKDAMSANLMKTISTHYSFHARGFGVLWTIASSSIFMESGKTHILEGALLVLKDLFP
eukprot:Clim_evm100s88 gene=Clim_evmTU100s88